MSLLLDDRIKFLVGFILAAIVIAIVLFLVEAHLRKKEHQKNRKLQQTPEDRIKIYISSSKSVQDKLAFIDKTAKDYFRDMYGFPDTSSYSFLIKELEKRNHSREVEFCKEMFSLFYSKKEISREQIKDVGKMLIEMERHRTVEKEDLKDVSNDKIKIPIIDVKKRMKEKEDDISRLPPTKADVEHKEIVGSRIKKMAEEDESITKKKIDEIKKEDEKLRQEREKAERLERESEKRILDRKKLVDKRKARRAEKEREKRRRKELKKKRKEEEKQRRREMYWRAEAEKQERRKRKDRQKMEAKLLEQKKREQAERESRRLKEDKLEELKKEKISAIRGTESNVASSKNEGIASRIVRLQKEKLGHSS